MSREILFSAKRKDNGEWVEGFYLRKYDVFGEFRHLIYWAKDYLNWEYYEVQPETVCQYTGLSDENGKRYENHIFQASDGDYIQRYVIKWNDEFLEWSAECTGDPDGTLPLSEFRVSEIEVIGNIFDNPELLGGDDD